MKKKVKQEDVEKVVRKGNKVELGLRKRNIILSRIAQAINYGYRIG